MDINQYIGAFLLKNRYCSLPGLGVFDLKRVGASAQSAEGKVSPPMYDITFNPVGSIDDTFASFIASKENVSIANASNHIRTYCIEVKDLLQKGGKFEVPNLGRFEMRNGKIAFFQSNDLNLGVEPVPAVFTEIKVAAPPQEEAKLDYSYTSSGKSDYRRKKNLNVMKFIVPAAAVLLLLVISYFGYTYYQENKSVSPEEATPENNTPVSVPQADTQQSSTPLSADTLVPTTTVDTSVNKDTSLVQTPTPPPPAPIGKEYRVVVFSSTDQAAANAKSQKWARYGNKSNVIPMNGAFVVTIDASHPLNDTTKLVDSLRRFFNPKGDVHILK